MQSNELKILVVEDERISRELLEYVLAREGYKVTAVSDGLKAQELINSGEQFALCILDMMLPYMSGQELLVWIKQHPNCKDTPVIIVTSLQDEEDIVKALDAGAEDYVTKPFQPRELYARIRRALKD